MITMDNWATQAMDKLAKEVGAVTGQKEKVMAPAVHNAIKDFCLQEETFAQKVAQGGTFVDCMKAVAKNVGYGISDVEAYKRAVQFYFPGAEVKMQLTIELAEKKQNAADGDKLVTGGPDMILDLASFF